MSGEEIRLIACDMDGTLLDSRKRMPPDMPAVLQALRERDIVFVVASGRQYASLQRDFVGLDKGMYYLCENGALVARDGKPLLVEPLSAESAAELVRCARQIPGAHPLVCADDCAWYEGEEGGESEYARNVLQYYARHQHCDDLLQVLPKVRICKVAVFDDGEAEQNIYPRLRRLASAERSVCLSGHRWVDIMRAGVNQGTAVQFLQRTLGIGPAQCMAFGDYLNDLEMLQACGESYAMKNAYPLLKESCRYVTEYSNDEGGVRETLRQRLGI
jgi:Cof subfamily protein (haloacid dehalogenase superfamily)